MVRAPYSIESGLPMLKKWKIDRIISILTLVTSVIAVYLVMASTVFAIPA